MTPKIVPLHLMARDDSQMFSASNVTVIGPVTVVTQKMEEKLVTVKRRG